MPEEPFTAFAEVYDAVMADVEYDTWRDFILMMADAAGVSPGRVLELGCGTGSLALSLARAGWRPTGLDSSEQMLAVARAKAPELEWVHGDFRDFSLGRAFPLVVSIFDTLNNLVDPADFKRMARSVHDHLEPDGLFVFDVNTQAGLQDLWEGDRVEGWTDDLHYLWMHEYDPEARLATVTATFELADRTFTELHVERPYEVQELRDLLGAAGFASVDIRDFPEGEPVREDSPRLWVVARR